MACLALVATAVAGPAVFAAKASAPTARTDAAAKPNVYQISVTGMT